MTYKYLACAALLIATACPLGAQSVSAGTDEWQKSNYSGAVAIWRPLAEEGNADAEFNLGQAYRLGRGVQSNPAAAKIWFERAANQGHVDAETTLGLLLFQSGDKAEGLNWLKKAADKGEPRAELVYGTALVNGDAVTQDPALGYTYVKQAADAGLEPARDTLTQLDKLLPPSSRKHGLALGRALAKETSSSKARHSEKLAQASGSPSSRIPASPTGERPMSTSPRGREAKASQMAAAKPLIETEKKSEKMPAEKLSLGERPAGKWRIQLGAFSKRSNAEDLYKRLAGNSAIDGRQALYLPKGSVTRLQVGPFESRPSAEAACAKIKVSCFVVLAD